MKTLYKSKNSKPDERNFNNMQSASVFGSTVRVKTIIILHVHFAYIILAGIIIIVIQVIIMTKEN